MKKTPNKGAYAFKWIEELQLLVDRDDHGKLKDILQDIEAKYQLFQQTAEDERKWFEGLLELANKNENGKIKSILQEANSAKGNKIIYPWSPGEAGEGDNDLKAIFKARRRWV